MSEMTSEEARQVGDAEEAIVSALNTAGCPPNVSLEALTAVLAALTKGLGYPVGMVKAAVDVEYERADVELEFTPVSGGN